MTVIGEAFIQVRPDTKGFSEETEQSVTGSIGKTATKIAGIVGGAFAAAGAVSFFKDAITGASDLSETISKNRVIFGQSADAVIAFGDNAATALGQSRSQALEATGVFGNLFRSMQIGEGTSADMSTTLVKLAGDLASFNNVSPDEALEALRSGLVGETEPLRKFGVNLNEASIQAKAVQLGIAGATGTLSPAAKAQASYALILEQTTLAQGDFARTSGGLANQQRILSAQWQDMKAKIGGLLLPVVTKLATVANNVLLPGILALGRALGSVLGPAFETVSGIASQLFDVLFKGDFTGGILSEDSPIVAGAFAIREAIAATAGAAKQLFDVLFRGDFTGGPLDEDSPIVDGAFRLRDAILGVFDAITAAWGAFLSGFADDSVDLDGPLGVFQTFGSGVAAVFDSIKGVFGSVGQFVADHPQIFGLGGIGVDAAITAWQRFRDEGINPVETAYKTLAEDIKPVTDLLREQQNVLLPLAAAAAGFVTAFVGFSKITTAVSGVSSAIGGLGALLGEGGPLAGLLAGGPVGLIVAGIVALAAAFTVAYLKIQPFHDAVDAVAGTIRDIAVAAFDKLRIVLEAIAPVLQTIAGAAGAAFSGLAGAATGIASAVVGALQPIVDWFVENLAPTLAAAADFFSILTTRIIQVLTPFVAGFVNSMDVIVHLIGDQLVAAFKIAAPIIEGALNTIGAVIQTLAEVAVPILATAVDVLRVVFENSFGVMLHIVEGTLGAIRGIFNIFAGILHGDFSQIWEGLVGLVSAPFETVRSIIEGVFNSIATLFTNLPSRLGALVAAAFDGVVRLIQVQLENLPKIAAGIVDAFVGFFSSLPGRIAQLFTGSELGRIGSALLGAVGGALEGLGGLLTQLGPTVAEGAAAIGEAILSGIAGGLTALPETLGGLGSALLDALGKAVGVAIDGIAGFFADLPGKIASVLSDLPSKLSVVVEKLIQGLLISFLAVPAGLVLIVSKVGPLLISAFQTAFSAVASALPGILEGIVGFFVGLPGLIFEALGSLGELLSTAFSTAIDAALQFFIDLPARIVEAVVGLADVAIQIGAGLQSGLVTAVGAAIDAAVQFFIDMPGRILGLIVDLGAAVFSFADEARRKLHDIIFDAAESTIGFFRDMPGRIIGLIGDIGSAVFAFADEARRKLHDIIFEGVEAALGFFRDMPGRLLGFVAEIGSAALSIGQSILSKLFEGLGELPGRAAELAGNLLNAVRDLGKNIINGVIDALNNLLPDQIGRIEVLGHTIFPGLDLPDNPIPRLAKGAFVRRRPDGTLAVVGEGATDEAILPLPRGVLEGLQRIASGAFAQPTLVAGGDRTVVVNLQIAAGALLFQGTPTPDEARAAGRALIDGAEQRLAERQLGVVARTAIGV